MHITDEFKSGSDLSAVYVNRSMSRQTLKKCIPSVKKSTTDCF